MANAKQKQSRVQPYPLPKSVRLELPTLDGDCFLLPLYLVDSEDDYPRTEAEFSLSVDTVDLAAYLEGSRSPHDSSSSAFADRALLQRAFAADFVDWDTERLLTSTGLEYRLLALRDAYRIVRNVYLAVQGYAISNPSPNDEARIAALGRVVHWLETITHCDYSDTFAAVCRRGARVGAAIAPLHGGLVRRHPDHPDLYSVKDMFECTVSTPILPVARQPELSPKNWYAEVATSATLVGDPVDFSGVFKGHLLRLTGGPLRGVWASRDALLQYVLWMAPTRVPLFPVDLDAVYRIIHLRGRVASKQTVVSVPKRAEVPNTEYDPARLTDNEDI